MAPSPPPPESDPFRRLVAIMERLLDPDGCPWDREQTHESLKPYVIEEAYEVCEAVDAGDAEALREELGDLALQVVFHAALARREKAFDIDDVMSEICAKLIRRHPHVFGDVDVEGAQGVLRNWEQIKREEKERKARERAAAANGEANAASAPPPHGLQADDAGGAASAPPTAAPAGPVPSALDGVPRALPALTRATRVQEKAARIGFDWDRTEEVWKKVEEELRELREAEASGDTKHISEELGDLLFALVNLSRFLGVHAEESLQLTNNKFIRRFRRVETFARARGLDLSRMTLPEMDALWDEAKAEERGEPGQQG